MRYALLAVAIVGCGRSETIDKAKAALERGDQAAAKAEVDSKRGEAAVQLDRIVRLAKMALAERAEFPIGKVGPTPAKPCCDGGTACQPDAAAWSDGVWKTLGFSIEESHRYQYSFESDGKTFTAKAIGCGDHAGTWTASGRNEAGNPVVDITPP